MNNNLRTIRIWLAFFMVALFLSGLTAIPVNQELSFLMRCFPVQSDIHQWLFRVWAAYTEVQREHTFLLYGYDWLAFAHFILALLFIGPFCDPVRNIWVIQFGIMACVLVFPLAFIAGPFRGIPIGWRLIDCSFGAVGLIPLWICYHKTKQLEHQTNRSL